MSYNLQKEEKNTVQAPVAVALLQLPLVIRPEIKTKKRLNWLDLWPKVSSQCQTAISLDWDKLRWLVEDKQVASWLGQTEISEKYLTQSHTELSVKYRSVVQYPERVDSLMVANACSGKAGWVEWGYQVVVNPLWYVAMLWSRIASISPFIFWWSLKLLYFSQFWTDIVNP